MRHNFGLSVIVIFCLIGFIVAKANAQIDPLNSPVEMYKICFNDAISRNTVSKKGKSLVFTCYNDVAKTFYETLGQYPYSRNTETFTVDGRVINARHTANDVTTDGRDGCYLQIQNQGRTTQVFYCMLYYHAGNFINE